jgi:hypothetical protein
VACFICRRRSACPERGLRSAAAVCSREAAVCAQHIPCSRPVASNADPITNRCGAHPPSTERRCSECRYFEPVSVCSWNGTTPVPPIGTQRSSTSFASLHHCVRIGRSDCTSTCTYIVPDTLKGVWHYYRVPVADPIVCRLHRRPVAVT